MVFQLADKGLKVCCCMGVNSAQVGFDVGALTVAADTCDLGATAVLAAKAGFAVWAKPVSEKIASPARAKLEKRSCSRNAKARLASINETGCRTGARAGNKTAFTIN